MPTPVCFVRSLCIAVLALSAAYTAHAAVDDDRFEAAMQLYHDGRYAASYTRLAELADTGHAESARIALLMLRFGPSLYGTRLTAPPQQVNRWLEVATSGRPLLFAKRTN